MATLQDRIDNTAKKLAQLKARELLAKQAEKTKAKREEKRKRLAAVQSLSREADAHRKILLGGLVIAAGADEWNEGEIVGALLAISERFAQDGGAVLREKFKDRGIAHLEARKAARASARA